MKGWLFSFLSAMSLLVFVAVVVLWAVSHRYAIALQLRHPPAEAATVTFHGGRVYYHESWFSRPQGWSAKFSIEVLDVHSPLRDWFPANAFGFAAGRADERYLVLPLWTLALLSALPAFAVILRWVRHRSRSGSSLCPSCGYDLCATPGRCPECGAVSGTASA